MEKERMEKVKKEKDEIKERNRLRERKTNNKQRKERGKEIFSDVNTISADSFSRFS